jgi:hypothetical protein
MSSFWILCNSALARSDDVNWNGANDHVAGDTSLMMIISKLDDTTEIHSRIFNLSACIREATDLKLPHMNVCCY